MDVLFLASKIYGRSVEALQILSEFVAMPDCASHVFPRHSRKSLPTVASGDGCYLIDTNGNRYLDGICGAAVSCLGHSDPTIVDAIKAQLDQVPFAHTTYFTSEPAEQLAAKLIENAPGTLDRVYFVTGGSEAIEAALKLARQYRLETGEPDRARIIARRQSYHGNTLGALATGGNAQRRAPFQPLLSDVSHIDPCYAYREKREDESEEAYGLRAAQSLEDEILRLGPETVLAFVAETVVGSTAGALPPAPGYFKRIREICDQYGVLLILDEIMCGMGRTGHLFACEAEGIAPDILCIAKGLGAGYQPIGAMLCNGDIHDAIASGSGAFMHGHTYVGHPTACAAGLAVLTALEERALVSRVQEQGAVLEKALHDAFGQHPHVGDIRGRGLFRAIELVDDRETKAPIQNAPTLHSDIQAAAFANGLMCFPSSGTIDGQLGHHVLLAPPFIISDSEIEELVGKLSAAIDVTLSKRIAA